MSRAKSKSDKPNGAARGFGAVLWQTAEEPLANFNFAECRNVFLMERAYVNT